MEKPINTHGDLPEDVRKRIRSVASSIEMWGADQIIKFATNETEDTPKPVEFAEGLLHGVAKIVVTAFKGGGMSDADILDAFKNIGDRLPAVGGQQLEAFNRYEQMVGALFEKPEMKLDA